ncbi:uncharacterized protein LOC113278911 [Papaver somniferum]|uniref:uncharacterized protein LOC113278911 n=1 Tax=Papaver somniferum TaxID=3469 RepID=UPI000E6FA527|nr:uncharacterized protein LOC113278911 [Papaver somniferum]
MASSSCSWDLPEDFIDNAVYFEFDEKKGTFVEVEGYFPQSPDSYSDIEDVEEISDEVVVDFLKSFEDAKQHLVDIMKCLDMVKTELKKKEFATKELGDLVYFLGTEAVRNSDSIILTQKKCTLELLSKANMVDSKPCDTPVIKGARVSIHDGTKLQNASEYRSIVGSLHYLTIIRPGICFPMNYVSQLMHSPTDVHLQLVKRILRYSKGTIGLGITLRKDNLHTLKAYTDSEWASCPDTRRSTSGYKVFLGSNLVSWSSKKQPTVSKSSAKAEYKCLFVASAELKCLVDLLSELHIFVLTPTILLCDNTSALSLASNLVFHARTKHIEIQYHTVR